MAAKLGGADTPATAAPAADVDDGFPALAGTPVSSFDAVASAGLGPLSNSNGYWYNRKSGYVGQVALSHGKATVASRTVDPNDTDFWVALGVASLAESIASMESNAAPASDSPASGEAAVIDALALTSAAIAQFGAANVAVAPQRLGTGLSNDVIVTPPVVNTLDDVDHHDEVVTPPVVVSTPDDVDHHDEIITPPVVVSTPDEVDHHDEVITPPVVSTSDDGEHQDDITTPTGPGTGTTGATSDGRTVSLLGGTEANSRLAHVPADWAGTVASVSPGDAARMATAAADYFVYIDSGAGNNVVDNFTAGSAAGHDVIEFSHAVFADWAQLLGASRQVGADTIITVDADSTITLTGVTLSSLTADDFNIV